MITGIMLKAIVQYINELNVKYIRKFSVLDKDLFALSLRTQNEVINIVFSPSDNMILPIKLPITFIKRKSSVKEDKFRGIKNILNNAKFVNVTQPDLERIIIFNIEKERNKYSLIIELFRKGNIILIDNSRNILYVYNPLKVRDRTLKVGVKYKFPPIKSPISNFEFIFQEPSKLLNYVKKLKDLFRALAVDKYTLNYIIKSTSADTYENIEEIVNTVINKLYDLLSNFNEYCIAEVEKDKYLLFPFKADTYKILACSDDLTDISTLYFKKYIEKKYKMGLESKIQELKRKIEDLKKEKQLLMEKIRILEELIPMLYTYISEINEIFSFLKSNIEKPYTKNIEIIDIDRKGKTVKLKIREKDWYFSLNYSKSVYEAIGDLYNELKKKKLGIKKINNRISELSSQLEILVSKSTLEDEKLDKVFQFKVRKRYWFERFLWFYTSKNKLLVISGRDATSNEILIKKYAEKNDIILHADIHGSPFTVIKNGLEKADEEDIYEAAIFTASYSNGWKYGFANLDVYWVILEQLSKSAPSGEYLSKGSFMIYGKRNYLRGIPLELYVGIIKINNNLIIYIAPRQAVLQQCDKIIGRLLPGDEEKFSIATRIVNKYKNIINSEFTKEVFDLLVSDVVNRLPPGKSTLIFM